VDLAIMAAPADLLPQEGRRVLLRGPRLRPGLAGWGLHDGERRGAGRSGLPRPVGAGPERTSWRWQPGHGRPSCWSS